VIQLTLFVSAPMPRAGSTLHSIIGSGIYFVPVWVILCTFLDQLGSKTG
jgi:hypothetical protein